MNAHPMDSQLARRGWKRIEFNDLPTEPLAKLPVRLVCRPVVVGASRPMMLSVNVSMWRSGELTYAELAAAPVVPPMVLSFLEQLITEGLKGASPIAMGVSPCSCPTTAKGRPRWNPLCMPLIWQENMDDTTLFSPLMNTYNVLLGVNKTWQCLDMRHLVF